MKSHKKHVAELCGLRPRLGQTPCLLGRPKSRSHTQQRDIRAALTAQPKQSLEAAPPDGSLGLVSGKFLLKQSSPSLSTLVSTKSSLKLNDETFLGRSVSILFTEFLLNVEERTCTSGRSRLLFKSTFQ